MLRAAAERYRGLPDRWRRALVVPSSLLMALLGVAGCGGDRPFVPPPLPAADEVYVSIGDSYAAGDQPAAHGELTTTRNGFAYQVADRLGTAGRPLKLLNLGCTGSTSTDLVTTPGCPNDGQALDGPPYPSMAQADAAISALRAYPDRVRLITVSIGGNDINACLGSAPESTGRSAKADDQRACVDRALNTVRTNLDALLTRIRGAAGPDVAVIGLTYPDVFLGAWVGGDTKAQETARASVDLFRDRFNPMLAATYAAHGATFVDITALSGAYGPWDQLTRLAPYGSLPAPVARVCQLTNYCSSGDLHPTTEGYTLITDAVLRQVRAG
jgi:lysophospholipase L1-like esterase